MCSTACICSFIAATCLSRWAMLRLVGASLSWPCSTAGAPAPPLAAHPGRPGDLPGGRGQLLDRHGDFLHGGALLGRRRALLLDGRGQGARIGRGRRRRVADRGRAGRSRPRPGPGRSPGGRSRAGPRRSPVPGCRRGTHRGTAGSGCIPTVVSSGWGPSARMKPRPRMFKAGPVGQQQHRRPITSPAPARRRRRRPAAAPSPRRR